AAIGSKYTSSIPADRTVDVLLDTDATSWTYATRQSLALNALYSGRSVVVLSGTASYYYDWCSWLYQNSFQWSQTPAMWTVYPFVLGAGCGIGNIDQTEDPSIGSEGGGLPRPLL